MSRKCNSHKSQAYLLGIMIMHQIRFEWRGQANMAVTRVFSFVNIVTINYPYWYQNGCSKE